MATFATEIVISATLTEIAAAFAAWEADWQKNPDGSLSFEEHLASLPEKIGGASAAHFVRLLAPRQSGGVIPEGDGQIDLEKALLLKQGRSPEVDHDGNDTSAADATDASAAETPVIPAIGEYWHGQGGIYAGEFQPEENGPKFHMILAAEEQEGIYAWGPRGVDEVGACSHDDGPANTRALIISSNQYPAAAIAAAYTADGHTDFYLGARREKYFCKENLPSLLAAGWYWTSTQDTAHYAWCQDSDGRQGWSGKLSKWRVRAVRRFLAI